MGVIISNVLSAEIGVGVAAKRDSFVLNEETLYLTIPFSPEEEKLFGPRAEYTGNAGGHWTVRLGSPLRQQTGHSLVFAVDSVDFVANAKRQVLDMGDFWYVYIPLTSDEYREITQFDQTEDSTLALRLRIEKDSLINRIPRLEQTNNELLEALKHLLTAAPLLSHGDDRVTGAQALVDRLEKKSAGLFREIPT